MSDSNAGQSTLINRLSALEKAILDQALPGMQVYIDLINSNSRLTNTRLTDTTSTPVKDIVREWIDTCEKLRTYGLAIRDRLKAGHDGLAEFAAGIVDEMEGATTRIKPLLRLLQKDRKLRESIGPRGAEMETHGPVHLLGKIEQEIRALRNQMETLKQN